MADLDLIFNKIVAKKGWQWILSPEMHPQAEISSHGSGPSLLCVLFRDMLRTSSFWGCLCPSGSGQVGDASIKAQLITLERPSELGQEWGSPRRIPQQSRAVQGPSSDFPPLPSTHTSMEKQRGQGWQRLLLQAPAGSSLPRREHGQVKSPCKGHS